MWHAVEEIEEPVAIEGRTYIVLKEPDSDSYTAVIKASNNTPYDLTYSNFSAAAKDIFSHQRASLIGQLPSNMKIIHRETNKV